MAIPTFQTLKTRPDFLAVRGGIRVSTASFLMEAKLRAQTPLTAPRFGFTVTKKLGCAVRRNRIRRRLKAAIAAGAGTLGTVGYDYVLVARAAAFDRPYTDLVADVAYALQRVHSLNSAGLARRPNPTSRRQKNL